MSQQPFPDEFLQLLKAVKGKRSRIVVNHILQHGFITTETLETVYGYKHAPRAIRDVREQGIPLETFTVKDAEGRTIAAYRFGDRSQIQYGRIGGRSAFPKTTKEHLQRQTDNTCMLCGEQYLANFLQVDHRIPYEVIGTSHEAQSEPMLLCRSCNRSKSWACEHCSNWRETKDHALCETCYWAQPDRYAHVALIEIRRTELIWTGEEIHIHEALRKKAEEASLTLPEYIKSLILRDSHLQEPLD